MAGVVKFTKHITKPDKVVPDDIAKVQDNIAASFRELENNQILNGIFIRDILCTAVGSTTINHGLKRIPGGYLVTKIQNADLTYHETIRNEKMLVLFTSAAATIDLYLF